MTWSPLDPRFKMLFSYHYARTTDVAQFTTGFSGPPPMVFADSGAHSARTQGVTIKVEEYAQWCLRWGGHLGVVSNLDVIGAPSATYRNQKVLEGYGLDVVPVFHTGEDWGWLERYLSEGYRYIALGKLLGNAWKDLAPWLAKAFRLAEGRAVFHGFGMSVWEGLRDFPFYSVDSSTWSEGFRYGALRLFDGQRLVPIRVGDRDQIMRYRGLIRSYGYTPAEFYDRSLYTVHAAAGISAAAWKRFEMWLRERHGPISIPGSGASEGLHQYLANSRADRLRSGSVGVSQYVRLNSERTGHAVT